VGSHDGLLARSLGETEDHPDLWVALRLLEVCVLLILYVDPADHVARDHREPSIDPVGQNEPF
jgi:hypothetical protein